MNYFYCKPCPTVPENPNDPWYYATPLGKNTLSSMVKRMCEKANIDGKKTNHSLRVAGTSSLFVAGVPEKLIQWTGHISVNALRKYERTTDEQQLAVSKILTGAEESYDNALPCNPNLP